MIVETLSAGTTTLNALIAGALLFESLVDSKLFQQLTDKKDFNVKQAFQIWYQNEQAIMNPLLMVGLLLNAASYYITQNHEWLFGAGCLSVVIGWTSLMHNTVVKDLRKEDSDVTENVVAFKKHHIVRLALGIACLLAGNASSFPAISKA